MEVNKETGLLWWPSGKESAWNAGDVGSIPGLGRSPEKKMATQSSMLAGISHSWGAWWATAHGVAKKLYTTEKLNIQIYKDIHSKANNH